MSPTESGTSGQPGTRDLEHGGVGVDAGRLEGRAQVFEMPAGAAGDVEQRPGLRVVGERDLLDPSALGRVVLVGVDDVVEVGADRVHASQSDTAGRALWNAD